MCATLPLLTFGQRLDWSADATIFGTALDERDPALTAAPVGSLLRALCIRSDSMVCMKTSTDNGASWSAAVNLPALSGTPLVMTTADRDFQYVLIGERPAMRRLYRFASENDDWDLAIQAVIAPTRTPPVVAMSIACDVDFQPSEPYVNVCWTERTNSGLDEAIYFAQSRDQGRTFLEEQQVHAQPVSESAASELALTAAWQGNHERVMVAAAVDRAGSVPEEIRVFTSEDQGTIWASGIVIDSSAAVQRHPTAVAYGTTVVLAYERRVTVSAPRDIMLSYSPDGGQSFSPPLPVTDSHADESTPILVVDGAHGEFYLFYLVPDSIHDSANVVLRSGQIATPWMLSAPQIIGEFADANGGLAATRSAQGVAAAWVSRFITGDLDVRFDASWRGAGSSVRRELVPERTELGPAFPNPFNGVTTLAITLPSGRHTQLIVRDVLGRRIRDVGAGYLAAGSHLVHLDFRGLPSGMYTVVLEHSSTPAQKLMLVR